MRYQLANSKVPLPPHSNNEDIVIYDGSATKIIRHPLIILLLLSLAATMITAAVNAFAAAPFVLWFDDTVVLLLVMLIYMVAVGVVWDGVLLIIGLLSLTAQRLRPGIVGAGTTLEATKHLRFFSRHLWLPLSQLVITSVAILGTSNITLLNLKLLGSVTEWRDDHLWQIEGSIIEWMLGFTIDTAKWDMLYHSAWAIELFAAFVLIVVGRHLKVMLYYCVSMILLFYIGRFLGVFNPVMGPAFFHPELFGYLHGSVTDTTMQLVAGILAQSPENAVKQGGVLLGGVSAMPSLHVGMVSLTAYWLAIARRWTRYITVPWVVLVWSSTVLLGWHYILDGASGIVLAACCVGLTRWYFRPSGDVEPIS